MCKDSHLIRGRAGVSRHQYLPFHLRLSLELTTTLRLVESDQTRLNSRLEANQKLASVYLILGSHAVFI